VQLRHVDDVAHLLVVVGQQPAVVVARGALRHAERGAFRAHAQLDQPRVVVQRLLRQRPVAVRPAHRVDRVAPVVGVLDAPLAAQEFLPFVDHRLAQRGEQDRRRQPVQRRVAVGRHAPVVAGIFRDLVDVGHVVVALEIVHRLQRIERPRVHRTEHAAPQPVAVARPAHEILRRVAEVVVPRRPARAAQLVLVLAAPRAPRLGDQDRLRIDRPGHVADRQHRGHVDQLRQVEAEPVHVELLHVVADRVEDQPAHHGRFRLHVVAAGAVVGEAQVRIQAEIALLVDRRVDVRPADVVVDHVQHHGEALRMQVVHQLLELVVARALLRIPRVARFRREEIHRRVAPVVGIGALRELAGRQQFDHVRAQALHVVQPGALAQRAGQPRVLPALGGRRARGRMHRHAAHVAFVDHHVLRVRRFPGVVRPALEPLVRRVRIDHDRQPVGVRRRAAIRIAHHRVRAEAFPVARRPVHAEAVEAAHVQPARGDLPDAVRRILPHPVFFRRRKALEARRPGHRHRPVEEAQPRVARARRENPVGRRAALLVQNRAQRLVAGDFVEHAVRRGHHAQGLVRHPVEAQHVRFGQVQRLRQVHADFRAAGAQQVQLQVHAAFAVRQRVRRAFRRRQPFRAVQHELEDQFLFPRRQAHAAQLRRALPGARQAAALQFPLAAPAAAVPAREVAGHRHFRFPRQFQAVHRRIEQERHHPLGEEIARPPRVLHLRDHFRPDHRHGRVQRRRRRDPRRQALAEKHADQLEIVDRRPLDHRRLPLDFPGEVDRQHAVVAAFPLAVDDELEFLPAQPRVQRAHVELPEVLPGRRQRHRHPPGIPGARDLDVRHRHHLPQGVGVGIGRIEAQERRGLVPQDRPRVQPLRLLRARPRRRGPDRQRTVDDRLMKESRHTLQVKRYRKIPARRQKIRNAPPNKRPRSRLSHGPIRFRAVPCREPQALRPKLPAT